MNNPQNLPNVIQAFGEALQANPLTDNTLEIQITITREGNRAVRYRFNKSGELVARHNRYYNKPQFGSQAAYERYLAEQRERNSLRDGLYYRNPEREAYQREYQKEYQQKLRESRRESRR